MKDNWLAYGVLAATVGFGACSSPKQAESPEANLAQEFGKEDTTAFTPLVKDTPAAPTGETAVDSATQPDFKTLHSEQVTETADAPARTAPRFDDQTQNVIDAFACGQSEVLHYVPIHVDTRVGQYADHAWYRFTVVGHLDGLPLVEQVFREYTIAYLIDTDSRHDSEDVVRAWVGRAGYAPTEVEVPFAQTATRKEAKMHREPFAGMLFGGDEYDGYVESPKGSVIGTHYWKTSSLPFDGLIQKRIGNKTTRIEYGTDGKATLDWANLKLDSQD